MKRNARALTIDIMKPASLFKKKITKTKNFLKITKILKYCFENQDDLRQ